MSKPIFPIGADRIRRERETPAVRSDFVPPPRPTAAETPFRSRLFVTARHSADGNSYSVGDPIPEVEENRQRKSLGVRPECPKCEGSGKRSRMKGHKPGCRCVGCKPCAACGGSGFAE